MKKLLFILLFASACFAEVKPGEVYAFDSQNPFTHAYYLSVVLETRENENGDVFVLYKVIDLNDENKTLRENVLTEPQFKLTYKFQRKATKADTVMFRLK